MPLDDLLDDSDGQVDNGAVVPEFSGPFELSIDQLIKLEALPNAQSRSARYGDRVGVICKRSSNDLTIVNFTAVSPMGAPTYSLSFYYLFDKDWQCHMMNGTPSEVVDFLDNVEVFAVGANPIAY